MAPFARPILSKQRFTRNAFGKWPCFPTLASQNGIPGKTNLMHHRLLIVLTFFCCQSIFSQTQDGILENYVQLALDGNHGLREQQFLLEKNMLALEEAKRLFRPEVGFGASYTLATGGRTIVIPVGDLVNPVYATLNQLTGTNQFPQIENVEEQFFPTNFYDARIRITQPLVNREIYFNRQIKAQQISLKQAEIRVFQRELVREVKLAYFRYRQASEAVKIYDSALVLLAENQRVNESLLRNDKVIPSVLLRVQSDITEVQAQRNQALTDQRNAAAYLNFLLNRDLETPIEVADGEFSGDVGIAANAARREELDQLATAQKINALVVELERSYRIPQVGAQVDIGSQNFDFEYGGYLLGGLSVSVPIYAGGRNELQVQQAQLESMATAEKTKQVERQIELQVATTRNSLLAEVETWRSYEAQLANARRQYDDTFRRYREGVANYIEVLDARTQATNIELRQNVARFNVLMQQAELERALGSYPLP